MFYSVDKTEELSLGHSLSDDSAEVICSKEAMGEPGYEFLHQKPGSWNIKR